MGANREVALPVVAIQEVAFPVVDGSVDSPNREVLCQVRYRVGALLAGVSPEVEFPVGEYRGGYPEFQDDHPE